MVNKPVPKINHKHLAKTATSVDSPNRDFISKHTRECAELNEAKNCKITTSKDLTKEQKYFYNESFERQRRKEASAVNKKAKKKKENQ